MAYTSYKVFNDDKSFTYQTLSDTFRVNGENKPVLLLTTLSSLLLAFFLFKTSLLMFICHGWSKLERLTNRLPSQN